MSHFGGRIGSLDGRHVGDGMLPILSRWLEWRRRKRSAIAATVRHFEATTGKRAPLRHHLRHRRKGGRAAFGPCFASKRSGRLTGRYSTEPDPSVTDRRGRCQSMSEEIERVGRRGTATHGCRKVACERMSKRHLDLGTTRATGVDFNHSVLGNTKGNLNQQRSCQCQTMPASAS